MTPNELIAKINLLITTNGTEAITGAITNEVLIDIINLIKASGNIEPFDINKPYSNVSPDYVTYNENIYECLSATPITGVIPGTDVLKWKNTSIGVFSHTHLNKLLLDTYTQTNTDITSAISLKHTHSNKATLDLIAGINVANGILKLNASTLIDTQFLPSYVDDVLEYVSLSAFPVTGETGKIYVDTSNNAQYRWSGTTYIQMSGGLISSINGKIGIVVLTTDDVAEGSTNKYNKQADWNQATTSAPDYIKNKPAIHTHNNYSLLETYTNSNFDISYAITKSHYANQDFKIQYLGGAGAAINCLNNGIQATGNFLFQDNAAVAKTLTLGGTSYSSDYLLRLNQATKGAISVDSYFDYTFFFQSNLFSLEVRNNNPIAAIINTKNLTRLTNSAGIKTTVTNVYNSAFQESNANVVELISTHSHAENFENKPVDNLIAHKITVTARAGAVNACALEIGDITGATNNTAFKTGLGVVSFGDKVGIGTTSIESGFILDVNGLSAIGSISSTRLYLGTLDATTSFIQSRDQATNQNLAIIVEKVGIGTTTPTSKLQVVGLPTSSVGLTAGAFWNNSGVVNIIS